MSDELIQLLLGPQALVVFLLLVLFAGWRGWWVWGKQYAKLEAEKDEWKQAALRGTRVLERTLDVAEKAGP